MPAFWDATTKSIIVTFDPAHETVDITSIYANVVPNMMVKKVDTSADVGYPVIAHHWRSDQIISADPAPWPVQNPPNPAMRYIITPKFIDKNGLERPYPAPDPSMPPSQVGPNTLEYRFDFTALATRGGDNGQTSIAIQYEATGGGGSGESGGIVVDPVFIPDWIREIIRERVEVMLVRNNFIPKPPIGPDPKAKKKKIKNRVIKRK